MSQDDYFLFSDLQSLNQIYISRVLCCRHCEFNEENGYMFLKVD